MKILSTLSIQSQKLDDTCKKYVYVDSGQIEAGKRVYQESKAIFGGSDLSTLTHFLY